MGGATMTRYGETYRCARCHEEGVAGQELEEQFDQYGAVLGDIEADIVQLERFEPVVGMEPVPARPIGVGQFLRAKA